MLGYVQLHIGNSRNGVSLASAEAATEGDSAAASAEAATESDSAADRTDRAGRTLVVGGAVAVGAYIATANDEHSGGQQQRALAQADAGTRIPKCKQFKHASRASKQTHKVRPCTGGSRRHRRSTLRNATQTNENQGLEPYNRRSARHGAPWRARERGQQYPASAQLHGHPMPDRCRTPLEASPTPLRPWPGWVRTCIAAKESVHSASASAS